MKNASNPRTITEEPSPLTTDDSTFEISEYKYDDGVFTVQLRGDFAGETYFFEERIDFSQAKSAIRPSEALLRLLALTVSLSYYKATLANSIRVNFPLSSTEVRYFTTVIENGLGEYAFVNDTAWKLTPRIEAETRDEKFVSRSLRSARRPLVAVGGGKDSIVTIEALKSAGYSPLLFSVNDRGSIRPTVQASGLEYVTVHRKIDPLLIRINQEGAPNGHVPVTAINSLIGLILADIAQSGPVIFSNEESANYGNVSWHGREINHQWSKSLEYEDLLRDTISYAGIPKSSYFSLLRGYRELEIARKFSKHTVYYDSFTSCNRAYRISLVDRTSAWCGECAKCAFVFLLLAPFISRQRLNAIFGKDLLDDMNLRQHFVDILGVGTQKPFECVGEPLEAQEALAMIDAGGEWEGSSLVGELKAMTPAFELTRMSEHPPAADRVPDEFAPARDSIGRV